jgi:hypothetical protein
MGQDFIAFLRIEVRILDPGEAFTPAGYSGPLCHGAIGPAVCQDDDAELARRVVPLSSGGPTRS